MAARFTKGDSMRTTVDTAQRGQVREPRRSNTMEGMPSWIDTGANGKRGGNVQGGKTIAPRGPPGAGNRAGPGQGRYIGHKGRSDNEGKIHAGEAVGTMGGRSAWMGGGHRGRMERLAGKAKSFGERKGGKTTMY